MTPQHQARGEKGGAEWMTIDGTTGFTAFVRQHAEFFRQKFKHLIGKPLYYGKDANGSSLGLIKRVELGDYAAIYTDDSRWVRVMLCSSGGATGPCDGEGVLGYLLPQEVSTPCKQIGPTHAHYLSPIIDLRIPEVLWSIIQRYDGPRSWTCTTTEEFVTLDAWFGPFFTTFTHYYDPIKTIWLK